MDGPIKLIGKIWAYRENLKNYVKRMVFRKIYVANMGQDILNVFYHFIEGPYRIRWAPFSESQIY